jgi:hypothetical protein
VSRNAGAFTNVAMQARIDEMELAHIIANNGVNTLLTIRPDEDETTLPKQLNLVAK